MRPPVESRWSCAISRQAQVRSPSKSSRQTQIRCTQAFASLKCPQNSKMAHSAAPPLSLLKEPRCRAPALPRAPRPAQAANLPSSRMRQICRLRRIMPLQSSRGPSMIIARSSSCATAPLRTPHSRLPQRKAVAPKRSQVSLVSQL